MITTVALQALTDGLTVPDGGFTVDLVTGCRPSYGFAVSIFPRAERVLSHPVTCEDLIEYVTERHDGLIESGHLFGGWHDPQSSKIYLDVSAWVTTAERAERLGQAHGQLAYFDLVRGRSVRCAPALL